MTLLQVDGFDHYTSQAQGNAKGWSYNGYNGTSPGRFGGLCMNGANGIMRSFPAALATSIVGVAFKAGGLFGNILSLVDGGLGSTQLTVALTGTGALTVTGAALLATSNANLVKPGAWNYLELKATINNATGAYAVRLNGAAVPGLPDAVNVNTRGATGNNWATGYTFGLNCGGNLNYDDSYACDTAGAVNNAFLGDVRISTLLPNGAGFYTQWATLVGAATHWQAVSDSPPDDDASYVADLTPGDLDSYAMGDLPSVSGTVPGLVVDAYARKDDGNLRQVAAIARSAAVDKVGATQTLTGSYAFYTEVMETDPSAAAWTIASVNGAEFGIKEVA